MKKDFFCIKNLSILTCRQSFFKLEFYDTNTSIFTVKNKIVKVTERVDDFSVKRTEIYFDDGTTVFTTESIESIFNRLNNDEVVENKNKIKIKKLHPNAKIPQRAHDTDACYDVWAVSKEHLGDGRIKYGLGFALELPNKTQLDLRARSSIHKYGLILTNSVGTGDFSYRGEYQAVFYKIIPTLPDYEVGDRILQIQIPGHFDLEFEEVDELTPTERGSGAYGSTGTK